MQAILSKSFKNGGDYMVKEYSFSLPLSYTGTANYTIDVSQPEYTAISAGISYCYTNIPVYDVNQPNASCSCSLDGNTAAVAVSVGPNQSHGIRANARIMVGYIKN